MPLDSRISEETAADLLGMLHANAPAEAFAARLARVEALPDSMLGKPGMVELVRMGLALRNRIELHEQRERGMLAVIESAQDLSGRLDLQGLLKAIAARARNLMGAHLCWLTVVDDRTGIFQVVVADGAISQRTAGMTAGPALGVAGVVMSTRLPFSTPDYLHDTRFAHDPALDETFREEGIAALVGAPLIRDDRVIGLLFVADRYHRSHTALNVSILCTLATHAAVAINNAKAFAEAQEALRLADRAHAELERHARDVQGAAEAHEQLTSLLARGAPLGEMCDSVVRQLGGSVLVLDPAGQVRGSATAPDYPGTAAAEYRASGGRSAEVARALRESRRAGRSVPAYREGDELCRAIAVIGGGDTLGAVLLFRQEDLHGVALRNFERSSSVIGIVMLSEERVEAEKGRDVSALVRALLSPRRDTPRPAPERAARFGLDLSQPVCLLAIEVEHSTAGAWLRRLRAHAPLDEQVVDEADGLLVLVCNATRAQGVAERIEAFAAQEIGQDYRGMLSRPIASPDGIPAACAAARRGLAVLARLGARSGIVAQNELALYSVLFETHDRSSLAEFLESAVGAVLAHDERRGSELAATLLAYFDSHQGVKAAASRLGIHANTMRQRLATAEDLLGHWGQASRAIEIHMALRLWRLCGAAPGADAA